MKRSLIALMSGAVFASPASADSDDGVDNLIQPEQQVEIVHALSAQLSERYVIVESGTLYRAALVQAQARGAFDEARSAPGVVALINQLLQSVEPDRHLGVLTPARFEEISVMFGLAVDEAGSVPGADRAVAAPGHAGHHVGVGQDHSERGRMPPGAAGHASEVNEAGAADPSDARRQREAEGLTRLQELTGITGVSEISRDGLNQVGYLAFERLIGSPQSAATIDRVMATFTESDHLVLDLRACAGGDVAAVSALSSYFFAERTHFLSSQVRGGPAEERWTTPGPLSAVFAERPLDVLVSEATFSACESLAFGLQRAGRARIMGQRTGGGGYMNDFYALPYGFGASISVGHSFDPRTGEGWQRGGIEPDRTFPVGHSLSGTLALITDASGRLERLSPAEREIHAVLQDYANAWYGADADLMAEVITPAYEAVLSSQQPVQRRDRAGQILATSDGVGVLTPLYHNRAVREVVVDGDAATARLILRETDHRLALVHLPAGWRVAQDVSRDKTLNK